MILLFPFFLEHVDCRVHCQSGGGGGLYFYSVL